MAGAKRTPPEQQPEDLRRDILESAIIGQEQARSAQQELDKQGRRLRVSLDRTKQIATQTKTTGKLVHRLVAERRAGPARTILDCCFGCCLRCCCGCCQRTNGGDHQQGGSNSKQQASPIGTEDEDAEEAETIAHLDRLIARSKQKTKQVSWKETLEPMAEALEGNRNTGLDIWYRQVDACLSQLQQVAEEMGDSLDEQIKLAQILAIYLDFGADQAMRANEKLATDGQ